MLYSKENQSSWIFFKFGKYSASAKCLLLSPLSLGCGQAVTVPADLNTDGLYGVSVVFQLERWHLSLSAHYCLLTSTVNNGCRMCVCVCVCVFVCACHDLHCAVKGYHRARKTSVKQLVSKQMIFWGAWLSSSITLSSVWDGTALGLNVFKEKFSILYDLDFFQYVSPSSSSSKGSDQSADYEVLLAASGMVSVWWREEKRLAAP